MTQEVRLRITLSFERDAGVSTQDLKSEMRAIAFHMRGIYSAREVIDADIIEEAGIYGTEPGVTWIPLLARVLPEDKDKEKNHG